MYHLEDLWFPLNLGEVDMHGLQTLIPTDC